MVPSKKIKTKDKIILSAIRMYNESGVQAITSRHIAAEMGISHGNLDYHYPTKEDLLLAIYKKMRTEMSAYFIARKENSSSIEHFHVLLIQLEEFQYRYRFINLDVLGITRDFHKISSLIKITSDLRKQQMNILFQEFISDGFMVETKSEDFEKLQHIIRIIVTFWLSQREVLATESFSEKGDMVKSIWSVVNPYLTENGKVEREKIMEEYSNLPKELSNENIL